MRPLDFWKLGCKFCNIYQLVAGAKAPTTKKPLSLKDVSAIPSTDFHCIAIPR